MTYSSQARQPGQAGGGNEAPWVIVANDDFNESSISHIDSNVSLESLM